MKSVIFWKSSLLFNKFYCVCMCFSKNVLSVKNVHISKTGSYYNLNPSTNALCEEEYNDLFSSFN